MTRGSDVYEDVSGRIETALALPRLAYLDETVFEDEKASVFRREWIVVARVEQLASTGSFLSVDVADVPLVITRDGDGTFHALSRICRHRAMPVVAGCGTTKAFTCPYHLWRYGLDGRLLSAPAMEKSEGFDVSKLGLQRYRAEVWQGWIFVNLDKDAPPLVQHFEKLTPFIAADGLADMKIVHSQTFPSPWNWKVFVENFAESYHHAGPHAESLQHSNPAFGTYALELPDDAPFMVLENPPAEGSDPFSVYVGFPTFLLAVQRGDVTTAVWFQMNIIDRMNFNVTIHAMMPEAIASDASLVSFMADVLRQIHLEDIGVCDGVQAGLNSPVMVPGPLSHLERGVWQFHRYLQRKMRAAG
ncbi:MAG: aromatic ring-hydroxylating dioxygenase subunit alpha [Parvibaculum sp.]|nr:aromatic ring-hydroxylating dioxygenase subunit alpha [Parvibaculum sp.]